MARTLVVMFAIDLLCAASCVPAAAQVRPERCQLKFVGPDPAEKISIESVEFRGNSQLSQATQDEIVHRLKSLSYDDTADLKAQVDLEVRNNLETRGYFEMEDTITITPVSAELEDKYRVVADVRSGEIFRAGTIQMVNARGNEVLLGIAPSTLRELFSLREGDVFDVPAIRDGIQKMARAYGEQGYLDATIAPEFEVNDAEHTVALTLRIDEQVQYRIGGVEALGVDGEMKNEFQSTVKTGDVLNSRTFGAFLSKFVREHGDALPPEVSYRDVRMRHDVRARTVLIQVDFRSCEQIPK